MSTDQFEHTRKKMLKAINKEPQQRAELVKRYGKVWDPAEFADEFIVDASAPPFNRVTKRSDGKIGSVMFQAEPRFYFSWMALPAKYQPVYSKPTMCLHCHQIVIMSHPAEADAATGAWTCPKCDHIYPFKHWNIKKQRGQR